MQSNKPPAAVLSAGQASRRRLPLLLPGRLHSDPRSATPHLARYGAFRRRAGELLGTCCCPFQPLDRARSRAAPNQRIGFHPPRYAAFLNQPSPSSRHSSIVRRRSSIARPSHRLCAVSQLMCVERPLPSQIICAGLGPLLRVGPLLIVRRYNYASKLVLDRASPHLIALRYT